MLSRNLQDRANIPFDEPGKYFPGGCAFYDQNNKANTFALARIIITTVLFPLFIVGTVFTKALLFFAFHSTNTTLSRSGSQSRSIRLRATIECYPAFHDNNKENN